MASSTSRRPLFDWITTSERKVEGQTILQNAIIQKIRITLGCIFQAVFLFISFPPRWTQHYLCHTPFPLPLCNSVHPTLSLELTLIGQINRYFPNFLQCPRNNGSKSRLTIMYLMHFLLSFISNLDFKLLFVSNEANSGSVFFPS